MPSKTVHASDEPELLANPAGTSELDIEQFHVSDSNQSKASIATVTVLLLPQLPLLPLL